MNGALALSATLSELDQAELEVLLADRFTKDPGPVSDTVSLALELLKPDSIKRVLAHRSRAELRALEEPNEAAPEIVRALLRVGLLGTHSGTAVPLAEVRDELAGMLAARNIDSGNIDAQSINAALRSTPSPATADERVPAEGDWVTPAFLAAQRSVLLLKVIEQDPCRLARSGEVLLAARTRLAERVHATPDEIRSLIFGLRLAHLAETRQVGGSDTAESLLKPTSGTGAWARGHHPDRWFEVAASLIARMPAKLAAARGRALNIRQSASVGIAHEFPLAEDREIEHIATYVDALELFGLTLGGVFTSVAASIADGEFEEALEATRNAFPASVTGIYLQPDLSIIAPGPLNPEDGLQLLEIADLTGPGLAATLTISERSVNRALDAGWTTDAIRTLFERLSLTGVPQPLDFLLTDLGAKHGTLIVEAPSEGSGARVRSSDSALIESMLIDRRVRSLGLARADDVTAVSRVSPEHVQAILVEARYPAILRSRGGDPARHRLERAQDLSTVERVRGGLLAGDLDARPTPQTEWAHRVAAELTERHQDSSQQHGVVQLLELATRTRTVLRVTVEARGREYVFRLLPLSVANGRLRALDQDSDLERTLPVDAIVSIDPLEHT